MTEARDGAHKATLFMVSDEIFEKLIARAEAVGDEMWRRQWFDNPGMLEDAPPEAVEYIRSLFVESIAERYVDNIARRASELSGSRP